MPVREILQATGLIDRSETLYRWLRAEGVPLRGRGTNRKRPSNLIPQELVPEILRLYATGLGAEKVAARIGVCRGTVYRYVRAAGLAVHPRGGYQGRRPRVAVEED